MNLSRLIFAINIIISCLRKSPIKHVLFTACMNRLYMYIILKMKGFCFVCNTQLWSYFWSNRSLFHFFSRSQRSPLNCSTQFWVSFKKSDVLVFSRWLLCVGHLKFLALENLRNHTVFLKQIGAISIVIVIPTVTYSQVIKVKTMVSEGLFFVKKKSHQFSGIANKVVHGISSKN